MSEAIATHFTTLVDAFVTISECYHVDGRLDDALSLLDSAEQVCQCHDMTAFDRARLLLMAGKLRVTAIFNNGADSQVALKTLNDAARAAEESGDVGQQSTALDLIGMAHYYTQLFLQSPDFSTADAYFQRALTQREQLGDTRAIAETLFHLGLVCQFRQQYDAAGDYFNRAYTLSKDNGHALEQSYAVRHIGFLHRFNGDFETARTSLEESLHLREQLGFRISLPFSHQSVGDVCLTLDDDTAAKHHYDRALELAEAMGNRRAQAITLLTLGDLHAKHEAWDDARAAYTQARELGEAIGHEVVVSMTTQKLDSLPE